MSSQQNLKISLSIIALAVVFVSYYASAGTAFSTLSRGGVGALFSAVLEKARPSGAQSTRLVRETSPKDDKAWKAMVDDISKAALAHPGRVGLLVRDFQSGREWTHHSEDLFPSASLIKLPILTAIFQRIKDGSLRLETKLTLRRRLRVGGSGTIKWHRDGTVFTVRELLDRMITESDNTATKMLVSYVGFYYLQKHFEKLGMVYTEIHPEGMRLQPSYPLLSPSPLAPNPSQHQSLFQ